MQAELITKKYDLNSENKNRELRDKQIRNLLEKLLKKEMHGIFYKSFDKLERPIKSNSEWLRLGNHNAKTEAYNFAMQDRNLFTLRKTGVCRFCKKAKANIDHLATRCGKLLHTLYIRRHNELVKSIHLRLLQTYGFSKTKRIKAHRITKVIKNDRTEIISEIPVRTDSFVQNNKPDLILHDFDKGLIYLVDIGITSSDNLRKTEIEKYQKYRFLAKEMERIYKRKVLIVPYVLTWDGLCTEFNLKYRNLIGIDDKLHAYMQWNVMKLAWEVVDALLGEKLDDMVIGIRKVETGKNKKMKLV